MAKEEKQGLSRSPDTDYNLFKEKCQDMKSLLTKIRTEGDPKNELKVEVALSFMELKQLNRYDKYRVKSLRDAVSTKRTKVDEFHLKLQNLLYEVIFLEKEIKRSLDYTSKADEIDLIDLETFLKEASSEFTGDVSHLMSLSSNLSFIYYSLYFTDQDKKGRTSVNSQSAGIRVEAENYFGRGNSTERITESRRHG